MDQTEQTQANPRRIRRWPIVALVLVLLASVAWWNWPRGDATPMTPETGKEVLAASASLVETDSDVESTRVFVASGEYRMSSRLAAVLLIGDDGHELRLPRPRITYWVTAKISNVDTPRIPGFRSPSIAGEVASFTVDLSSQNVWLQSGQKLGSMKVRFMPSIDNFESGRWACLGFDPQGQFVDCLYPVRPVDKPNQQTLSE